MKVLNIVASCSRDFSSFHNVHKSIAQVFSSKSHVDNCFISGCNADFSDSFRSEHWQGDARFLGYPYRVLRKKSRFSLRWYLLLRVLRRTVNDGNYDVLVCDGLLSANAVIESGLDISQKKIIFLIHGLSSLSKPRYRGFCRMLQEGFPDNWTFVAVSAPAMEHTLQYNPGLAGRLTYIENSIDVALFDAKLLERNQARAILGVSASDVVVGSIGRLSAEKDFLTLLNAVALLDDKTIKIVLIGEGKERASLEQQAAALGLSHRLLLPGWIDDASSLLRGFDVFVMSSVTEGLGLSLVEALLATVPAVASAAPALVSVVGSHPYVFPVGDFHALAGCITRLLLLSEIERNALVIKLRNESAQRFSFEKFRSLYLQMAGMN
jgi:glycosyltransferase involved in cell wall biosynthesis